MACVDWFTVTTTFRGRTPPTEVSTVAVNAFVEIVKLSAGAVAEIEKEIRALEPDDQEHLLRALLEELDGPADPDVEQVWLAGHS